MVEETDRIVPKKGLDKELLINVPTSIAEALFHHLHLGAL